MFGSVSLASTLSPECVGVIALIAVEHAGSGQALQKLFRRFAIGDLTAGQHERKGAAQAIGQRVDLGRAPPT